MRASDLLKFAWQAMTSRKTRAVLTITGIVIGPATIVALLGATQGYSNAVTSQFAKTGTTTVYVTPVGRGTSLTSADVTELETLPGVKTAIPYYDLTGTVSQGSGSTGTVQVIATDLSELSAAFPGLSLSTGATPSTDDLGAADIGNTVANPGFTGATNLTVDQVVSVTFGSSFGGFGAVIFAGGPGGGSSTPTASGTHSFIIEGVYSKYGEGFTISPDTAVFVNLAEGQQLTSSAHYSGVAVIATSANTVSDVTTEITDVYGSSVRATAVTSILSTIQSVTSGTGTILAAVAGVSVIVAFIGIMTTMFTTVVERIREIGVLKAIGYTSHSVLMIFLVEATITGLLGGIIGAGVGAGLSYLLIGYFGRGLTGVSLGGSGSSFAFSGASGAFRGASSAASRAASTATTATSSLHITPLITPELLLGAVALATAVGALAGLLPAYRASRMVPVQALRNE